VGREGEPFVRLIARASAIGALFFSIAVAHAATAPAGHAGSRAKHSGLLLRDSFNGADGLYTDARAFWDKNVPDNRTWAVEGGSWYRLSNTAWTNSPVFRVWSWRRDFRNVRVDMRLKTNRFTGGTPRRGPHRWDGVKIWMRRHMNSGRMQDGHAPAGYSAEIHLRSGQIYVTKKLPGCWSHGVCSEDGTYWVIGRTKRYRAHLGEWEHVGATVRNNPNGTVTITILRDGKVALQVVDRGGQGHHRAVEPIRGTGRIGIRGDNADFQVDNVRVTRQP
jgi:hypothetical protein